MPRSLYNALSILFYVTVLVWTASGPVSCEEPSKAGLEESKEYFNRAVILYKAKDFKGALKNFELAYEVRPHFKIKFNIGMCHFLMENNAAAGNELTSFLLHPDSSTETGMSEKALEALGEIKDRTGTLYIEIDMDEAQIVVDGEPMGTSPLNRGIYVAPGDHSITVTLADGATLKQTVGAAAGESRTITFSFKDVKVVEKVTVKAVEPADPEETVAKRQKEKSGTTRALAFSALALTTALLAGGVVTGAVAVSKAGELDDLDRSCEEAGCNLGSPVEYDDYVARRDGLLDDTTLSGKLCTGFLISGGILSAATVVLFVLAYRKPAGEKKLKTGLRPFTAPTGNGLAFELLF